MHRVYLKCILLACTIGVGLGAHCDPHVVGTVSNVPPDLVDALGADYLEQLATLPVSKREELVRVHDIWNYGLSNKRMDSTVDVVVLRQMWMRIVALFNELWEKGREFPQLKEFLKRNKRSGMTILERKASLLNDPKGKYQIRTSVPNKEQYIIISKTRVKLRAKFCIGSDFGVIIFFFLFLRVQIVRA